MQNTELYKLAEQHIKALKRLKAKHNKTKHKMQRDIEIITLDECKKIASEVVFLECSQQVEY